MQRVPSLRWVQEDFLDKGPLGSCLKDKGEAGGLPARLGQQLYKKASQPESHLKLPVSLQSHFNTSQGLFPFLRSPIGF